MTWKTVLLFIVIATFVSLLSGWLIKANLLPIQTEIKYSEAEQNFVKIWVKIALLIGGGVILPGIIFLVGIGNPQLRTVFGFYLLVVIVQLLTERIASRVFPSSSVVIVGTIYTIFRVWQIWQGQQFLKLNTQSDILSFAIFSITPILLWLMLLFWSANIIFLLVVGWSRILDFSVIS